MTQNNENISLCSYVYLMEHNEHDNFHNNFYQFTGRDRQRERERASDMNDTRYNNTARRYIGHGNSLDCLSIRTAYTFNCYHKKPVKKSRMK